MSEILDVLESLMLFYQDNFPDEVNSFFPGLPREQVISMFSDRSLPCPNEILDLYTWRNGTSSGFSSFYGLPPEFYFMPLEEVMAIYDEYNTPDNLVCLNTIDTDYGPDNIQNALADIGIDENHRMIHLVDAQESQFYSVVITAESTYVFLYMDEGDQKDLCFQSLTSMMQTIGASYQEGAYTIREDGGLALDPALFKQIWERYNPLLVQGPSAELVDRYLDAELET
ncbi:MAG: hypothetical protein F6K30_28070 [Cyanothece sp. SIO2G6]|nr:hypothetical protein [Cyanothece sp. SIO2G6]